MRTPTLRTCPKPYTLVSGFKSLLQRLRAFVGLKAQGKLTIFEASATQRAAFVSHQWVSRDHPDPEFRQMSVLQDSLNLEP